MKALRDLFITLQTVQNMEFSSSLMSLTRYKKTLNELFAMKKQIMPV